MGATLAESGLRRATPLATATLLLGANAPDVDIVSQIGGGDAMFYWRRGWTHGVLAMVVLPLAVTAVMLAWDRWVRRRRDPDLPRARAGPLLVLSYVSVLTHPALDWLNTYGVRLLMPFDGTWFYGDAIFIVDPWMWLLMAAAAVLARSRGRLSLAAWVVLGTGATGLILAAGIVPPAAQVAWLVGVGAIVALRTWRAARVRVERIAVVCLAVLLVYVGANVFGTRLARRQATEWLEAQGMAVEELAAGPVVANPFQRDVIVRSGDTYHFVRLDWLGQPLLRFSDDPIPVGGRGPVVEAALRSPEVRGTVGWMRFPSVSVRETDDGHEVILRDVRYARGDGPSLGTTVVHVPR